jgi:hypothetical protein
MPEPRPIRPTETLLLPTEVVALYGYVLRGPLTIHLNERSHQITINDYPLVLDPDEPGRLGGRVKSKIDVLARSHAAIAFASGVETRTDDG